MPDSQTSKLMRRLRRSICNGDIALATTGLNAGFAQAAAKSRDVHFDEIGGCRVLLQGVELVEEVLLGRSPPWMMHKVAQQHELGVGERVPRAFVHSDALVGLVQGDATQPQLTGESARLAAQQCLNPGDKLGFVEGFGQVVIRAAFKPEHLVFPGVPSRQDQYRQITTRLASPLEQVETRAIGKGPGP